MCDPHEPIKLRQIAQSSALKKPKNPSKEKRLYWLYAVRKIGTYPESTHRSGKWLLFPIHDEVDLMWQSVKNAVEGGLLGDAVKVSTKAARKMKKSAKHALCVYTYDRQDTIDVERIRNKLVEITEQIPEYKTNAATLGIE